MSGIKAGRGHCPFSKPSPTEPQSQQAGAVSETPPTWLTLFDPPWRSPETPPHPTHGPTQVLFHMKGWSWLLLHNFLNPLKQATASLSEPQAQH